MNDGIGCRLIISYSPLLLLLLLKSLSTKSLEYQRENLNEQDIRKKKEAASMPCDGHNKVNNKQANDEIGRGGEAQSLGIRNYFMMK